MTKKKKPSKRTVVRLIKDRLAAVGHGIIFEVIEAGVRADDDCWSAPVLARLRGKDLKRDVAVNIFANVENELYESDGLTVLIVPVVD